MEIIKAYRRELNPNNKTRNLLVQNAGAARFAYNFSLGRRKERYEKNEGKEKYTNAKKELKEIVKLKETTLSWMYRVSSRSIESAVRDLDTAYKNHRDHGVGLPQFKKKGVCADSFRLYGSIKPQSRYIKLPNLGKIRLKEKFGEIRGRITSATVKRIADRWYVSLCVKDEIDDPKPITGRKVGIDLGLTTFATVSDGTKLESPKPLKNLERKLKKAQKSLSRKEKKSKNRKKASLKLAKIHRKISNIRNDFLHKASTLLAKTKSAIVVEDLNVKGMMKNHKLAKSICDQGWGRFRGFLGYKTKWYGSKLIVADRWFASSKICSCCDYKLSKLPLHVRTWICLNCGVKHNRDENASVNLENYESHECRGTIKPVEVPLTAEREKFRSTSYVSLKQEAGSGSKRVKPVNDG